MYFRSSRRAMRVLATCALAFTSAFLVGCDDETVGPDRTTGSIELTVAGLPQGAPAQVSVHRGDYQHEVTASETISDLPFGQYTIDAAPVQVAGVPYGPLTVHQSVVIDAAQEYAAAVTYVELPTTGSVLVSTTGLPTDAITLWRLLDDDGDEVRADTIRSGRQVILTDVAPGAYTVAWSTTQVDDGDDTHTYGPVQVEIPVRVVAGEQVDASAQFAIRTGVLDVTVSGLPEGSQVTVGLYAGLPPSANRAFGSVPMPQPLRTAVVAQGGRAHFTNLAPGDYMVRWTSDVMVAQSNAEHTFRPERNNVATTVAAGLTGGEIGAEYAIATGALKIAPQGLPAGTSLGLQIVRVADQQLLHNGSAIAGQSVFSNLEPGDYQVRWLDAVVGCTTYRPAHEYDTVTVTRSMTPATATVGYEALPVTGALKIAPTGIPAGTSLGLQLTRLADQQLLHNGTALAGQTVFPNLEPGDYQVRWLDAAVGSTTYHPARQYDTVTVTASATPVSATVSYEAAPQVGALTIDIGGLPPGRMALIDLYDVQRQTTVYTAMPGRGDHTINNLPAGDYILYASPANEAYPVYWPDAPSKPVTVRAGQTASLTLMYTQGSSGAGLRTR